MAKCKICGKAAPTGVVMHRDCIRLAAEEIMSVVCDDYCKWREDCKTEEELIEHCEECKVCRLLIPAEEGERP